MACLVSSYSFSMRFCASEILDKAFVWLLGKLRKLRKINSSYGIYEIHPWRSALGRFSRPGTSRRAMKHLAPNCSNSGLSFVDRSCNHRLSKPFTHFCGSVSHHYIASSSTRTVISGFWVGPDIIEDGWGFVEAFVNQIA